MTPGQSQKNLPLSAAATDLGLGDSLKQQVEDTMNQRRDTALNSVGSTQGVFGEVNPTLSPAVASLLKTAGGGFG